MKDKVILRKTFDSILKGLKTFDIFKLEELEGYRRSSKLIHTFTRNTKLVYQCKATKRRCQVILGHSSDESVPLGLMVVSLRHPKELIIKPKSKIALNRHRSDIKDQLNSLTNRDISVILDGVTFTSVKKLAAKFRIPENTIDYLIKHKEDYL